VRLAPGQMPARQDVDSSVHGPIAHAFEALFSPAFTGFRPRAAALKAYRDFLKSAPLRPTRTLLPDDLVRIR
jgi:hypothetical protein